MPNWCSNVLKITFADEDQQDSFMNKVDRVKKKKEGLFSQFIPMPKELEETDGWYQWCLDNWGTKWDVDHNDLRVKEKRGSVKLSFDTAWGPPEEFYHWLQANLHLQFEAFYFEPGMDFAGMYTSTGESVETISYGDIGGGVKDGTLPQELIDEFDLEEYYAEAEEVE